MKITDLTSIEGDPDPERADVPDPRMYLEMRASGPWQLGLVKFIARCSERAPVARALVVWLLTAAGIALAAAAHYLLPAPHSGWVTAVVLVICLLLPFGMYQVMSYDPRRHRRRKSLPTRFFLDGCACPAHRLPPLAAPRGPEPPRRSWSPISREGPGRWDDGNPPSCPGQENLASRGYVVVAIDHTYDASEVEFPSGHLADSVLVVLIPQTPTQAHSSAGS